MSQRLSTIGILLLVMTLVAMGLMGCTRQYEERETQATEPASEATQPPSGGEEGPQAGETVVSAVTPSGQTPGTATQVPSSGAQATQVPVGETPTAGQPEATAVPGEATAAPPAAQPPESSETTGDYVWHTVRPGETLSSIARLYGTTWEAIAQANGMNNPNEIYVGQKLKVPTSGGSSGGTSPGGCSVQHTVQRGEWVWQIARDYGVSPYDILAANGLTIQSANTIYPGMVLCIP